MEHLLFVASNALALVASWSLSRHLIPSATLLERTLLTVAGVPLVVVPTLTLLGAFGALYPWPACLVVGAVAVASTVVWAPRRADVAPLSTSQSRLQDGIAWGTLGVAVWLAANLALRHLTSAFEYQWDDFSYHGPMPAHWVQTGRLGLSPYNYHAYYPGNGELFVAWFLLPTRDVGCASIAGLHWLLLTGLALAQLSRAIGASAAGAAAATIVYLVSRPFDHQARSFAAVDLATTALTTAALALACTYRGKSDRLVPWILYVAGLMGLAVGTKVTFAPAATMLLVWLLWESGTRDRTLWRAGALYAAVALVCGGAWYARNLWITGNPLFPADFLFFDGPLDAESRRPTSLLYQLLHLGSGSRARVLGELLAWPTEVATVAAAGYAATLATLVRPRWLRDPLARRRLLVCLVGLVTLYVIASGPFSGTTNARYAKVQIRLRFFLPFVVLGLPLAMYWLGRVPRLGMALPTLAALYVAHRAGTGLVPCLIAAAVAAAAFLVWRRFEWQLAPRWRVALAVALIALVPVGLDRAMVAKRPAVHERLRDDVRSWALLDRVPPGSRITWFSAVHGYKYFFVFGPMLEHVPVVLRSDGSRFVFMHENWRTERPTWWDRKKPRYKVNELVPNLLRHDVQYVLVVRRNNGKWPGHYRRLKDSREYEPIDRTHNAVLFSRAGQPSS